MAGPSPGSEMEESMHLVSHRILSNKRWTKLILPPKRHMNRQPMYTIESPFFAVVTSGKTGAD